jgi:outer membrane protein TolC
MKLIMKQYFMGCLLVVSSLAAFSQNNPPRNNNNTYSPNVKSTETDIRERLVALALQNPGYEISDRRVNVAEANLRKAKGAWLNVFFAQGNLNELSLNQSNGGGGGTGLEGQVFYPRYNFGVNIPLDFFSAKSNDVKVARETLLIAEAEKNERYRLIRRQVLTKYEDYLMHKEKLELQIRMTQAEYTKYKLAEKDFEENAINAEVFNKAEATYFEQQIRKSELQRNLNVVKLELEEMIGVSFDELVNKK